MKFLNEIKIQKNAAGAIPPSNDSAGIIFTSGSGALNKPYFSSSAGLFDLTDSKGYINVVEITGSSNQAWIKPGGLAYAQIIVVGGGGGGGGGARRPTGGICGGGGAGLGGQVSMVWFNASELPEGYYTASLSLAANGGAGATVNGTNGVNGGNGGITSLLNGAAVIATANGTLGGGGAAIGGSTVATSTGNVRTDSGLSANYLGPLHNPFMFSQFYRASDGGAPGGGFRGNFPYDPILNINSCTACGGGGGGITAAGAINAGGSGSAVVINNQPTYSGAPGGAASGVAGSAGLDYAYNASLIVGFGPTTLPVAIRPLYGLGAGGHGGGSGNTAGTIAGGNGGNGGLYGAGGGGGGGATNGANGGNGGNGAPGYICIIEYY
jgi:hypothetical protein